MTVLDLDGEDRDLLLRIHGYRGWMRDLDAQQRARPSAQTADRLRHVQREWAEVERAILEVAGHHSARGWRLFDEIKSTHDGAIQGLAQRLRQALPDRDIDLTSHFHTIPRP